MLGAMLFFPLLDVVAKFLGQQNVPVAEIVWARVTFGSAMTAPLALYLEGPRVLIPQRPIFHVSRALLMIVSTALFFGSLKFQGIADSLAVFFVQPLVITLLSPLVLGEHVGPRRWTAVGVGFLGTLIIIRPGLQELNPGVIMAFGAGTSVAIFMLMTRKIAGQEKALSATFHTSLAGGLLMSLALPFYWQEPSETQWLFFVLLGLIGTAGTYTVLKAYEHAEASLLAPLAYTEMITAVALGWYFFGDFPDHWTFVGVGILIACAIYISYRERVRNVPPLETPPTMIS